MIARDSDNNNSVSPNIKIIKGVRSSETYPKTKTLILYYLLDTMFDRSNLYLRGSLYLYNGCDAIMVAITEVTINFEDLHSNICNSPAKFRF